MPRSRVGIFRNERTRYTPLDPKLMFWCVSYYLGAVDAKINTLESEGKCSPSTESRPSVPVNLTWNWQGKKQNQIRERIGWDFECLSDKRIGKLCRYRKRQKDIKCKRVVKEHVGRISRCTKRRNWLWAADFTCITRSKLWMYNLDDVS